MFCDCCGGGGGGAGGTELLVGVAMRLVSWLPDFGGGMGGVAAWSGLKLAMMACVVKVIKLEGRRRGME